MKFKVWKEREEQQYYLDLVERPSGIYLRVVRPSGDAVSNLLRIKDSKISRCRGVDSFLGFPLDTDGKVILES